VRRAAVSATENHVMSSLNVLVPFTVFTDYKNRRSRAPDLTGISPAADPSSPSREQSGCTDASFASAETRPRAEPENERIPL
jgi:hypothetical protein